MSDAATLSVAEAAAWLGVKPATIYAYVSRGLLRSVPATTGRARRYPRADLERLRRRRGTPGRRGAGVSAALRWGDPLLESAITAIEPGGPRYRGHAAVELAEADTPFESVAQLLWSGTLPESAPRWAPRRAPGAPFPAGALEKLVPAGTAPIDALACLVPALGARDRERHLSGAAATLAQARALILRCAAGTAIGLAPDRARSARLDRGVAGVLATALGARGGRGGVRALNRALVLCADHELNTSAFAARVAASAGADLYASTAAALAALSGPRHGRHSDRVRALLEECGGPEGAERTVRARARRGEAIPGFGHPLYPDGDPRAVPLLAAAQALRADNKGVRTCEALIVAMAPSGMHPTLDIGLVALAAALGLPPGGATGVFAVGRMAGWVAHILEQRTTGVLLRPRARYVGV